MRLAFAASLMTLAAATVRAQAPPPGQHAPAQGRYNVWPSGCDALATAERVACLDAVARDFGTLARFAAANALVRPPLPGEARVVFFGDSITDGWSNPSMGGFFPGRPYYNRGIGGQTTAQMLLRFHADVIALQPKVVVILAGTNDLAGNAGPVEPRNIQDNLSDMAALARAHGVRVALATLLPVSDAARDAAGKPIVQTRARPPAAILELNAWIRGYAAREGHVLLDYYAATTDGAERLRADLSDDGLHPNAKGYARMAPLAETAIAQALKR
jgi:lysophospholipase L1-like esterase